MLIALEKGLIQLVNFIGENKHYQDIGEPPTQETLGEEKDSMTKSLWYLQEHAHFSSITRKRNSSWRPSCKTHFSSLENKESARIFLGGNQTLQENEVVSTRSGAIATGARTAAGCSMLQRSAQLAVDHFRDCQSVFSFGSPIVFFSIVFMF